MNQSFIFDLNEIALSIGKNFNYIKSFTQQKWFKKESKNVLVFRKNDYNIPKAYFVK